MSQIVPAILTESPSALQSKIAAVLKLPIKTIQIDFSDGVFTPRKTAQLEEMDLLNPTVQWEAHLMMEKPEDHFFDAKLVGFSTIIFHFEAIQDKSQISQLVSQLKGLNVKAGLAIGSKVNIDEVAPYLHIFDQVTLLTIHPGYSGQEMDPNTLERLRKLRSAFKNGIIEVDGGVKLANVKELSQAGADLLIANSALFSAGDPEQNLNELKNALL